jgi:hypothetical protein
MENWFGGYGPILMAEQRREEYLARYEYLRKHNLLDGLPEPPGLRSTAAGWLMRVAMRLDERIAEHAAQSAFPATPKHA